MSLEADLAALHQPLLRFAKLQRGNDSVAEGLVSEILFALREKANRFEGCDEPAGERPPKA
jgi:RNA polymerase sigma-70 factor (ECF subfamily)